MFAVNCSGLSTMNQPAENSSFRNSLLMGYADSMMSSMVMIMRQPSAV